MSAGDRTLWSELKALYTQLNTEREKFSMEKEKMEIEHKHQLELKQKEMENQVGADLFATMTKEYTYSYAIRNCKK